MRPTPDLSVYLVLDVAHCGTADPVAVACAAAEVGVACIQLRDKAGTFDGRVLLGREIRSAIAPLGGCLIMNDDVEAGVACAADGVHVGQGDMCVAQARELIGPDRILGLSIETVDQAGQVDPSLVDHVGIGPIRATTTKPDAADPLGFDGLARAVAACPVPAVAIGGVKASDADALARAGVAGLAVVSAICGQPDPGEASRDLVAATQRAGLRHRESAT